MTVQGLLSLRARIMEHLRSIPGCQFDVVMVQGGCLVEYVGETYINQLIVDKLVDLHKSLSGSESAFPLQVYHYLKKDNAFQKLAILRTERPSTDFTQLGSSNGFEAFAEVRLIDADAFHYRVFRPFKFEVKLSSQDDGYLDSISTKYRVIEINGQWHDLIKVEINRSSEGAATCLVTV